MKLCDGQHRWAIVLAAGEGTRLRSLTTGADGVPIPKQYCSFDGGPTLFDWAVRRAERAVGSSRIATVVAATHRVWVERELRKHPGLLAVVQPENKGTGPGILLPVLRILQRDPLATVLVLPSDHFVADEPVFARAAERATLLAERAPDTLVLLGASPEAADPDLGWILPGAVDENGIHRVDAFFEKPEQAWAQELISQGALISTFAFAARASTLLALCRRALPEIVDRMSRAAPAALAALYADLPHADFSRAILEETVEALRVLRMAPCGWNDLGTPARVAACVRHSASTPAARTPLRFPALDRAASLASRALAEERRRLDLAF